MIRPRGLRSLGLAPALWLEGCGAIGLGAMHPAGPIAEAQRNLYMQLAVVLVFVAGPVLVLTPLIAWHYRLSNKRGAYRPDWNFSWWLEVLIWLPPAGIVGGLGVLLWTSTHRLDPYRPIAPAQAPLEVQAVALDWKWLFLYPDDHLAMVNLLVIPAGRPVRISLTSGTVMQSLLIPRLAGQIYAMPGMRTQLNLAASRPGTYRGANVQYNGEGFARQSFAVIALSQADRVRWLARLRTTSQPLDQITITRLFARDTVARPMIFSSVPDGLFDAIMARTQAMPGKMSR